MFLHHLWHQQPDHTHTPKKARNIHSETKYHIPGKTVVRRNGHHVQEVIVVLVDVKYSE